jgi:hypothetical protein
MKDLPLMSTKEARKLLGKEAQGMDDDQVLAVILLLTDVAKAYLEKTANKLRKAE